MPDTITYTTSVPISAANGNTVTFYYPQPANGPKRSANSYVQGYLAVLSVRDLQNQYYQGIDFTLAYNELYVVMTIISSLVIPAQSAGVTPPHGTIRLQLPLLVDPVGSYGPLAGTDKYL